MRQLTDWWLPRKGMAVSLWSKEKTDLSSFQLAAL